MKIITLNDCPFKWNADYWYSRAGRQRPDITLEAEWRRLVEEMLGETQT